MMFEGAHFLVVPEGLHMAGYGPALVVHYDLRLVTLSILIAVFAAYAALDLAGRTTYARGIARFTWLCGSAVAMGTGMWAMHYTGMQALRLPVPVLYDWPTVLLSRAVAVFASGVALYVVSRRSMGILSAILGSLLMGGGIAAMHYIGMEAMRLPAICLYSPNLVALSIFLGVAISFAAIWLTFGLRDQVTFWSWRRSGGALLMGLAIPVTHYVGVAAVTFIPTTLRARRLGAFDCRTGPDYFRRSGTGGLSLASGPPLLDGAAVAGDVSGIYSRPGLFQGPRQPVSAR